MTDLELGWIAGILDGEGSISLDRIGNWRRPVVCVTSTDIEILTELKMLAGGCITPQKARKSTHKPAWIWKLNGGQQTIALLVKVVHIMRCPEKVRRAKHLIENYTNVTTRNGHYSPEERDRKVAFEAAFFGRLNSEELSLI